MNKVGILAVRYHEPSYESTKLCIEQCGLPVHYVERNPPGIGSLAEAINRGIRQMEECEYVFIVTNVVFTDSLIRSLTWFMELTGAAAIHPCFNSDHPHLRQQHNFDAANNFVLEVPFVEFTAPMVRYDLLKKYPLDEKCPYVGHDMAWGYDMRQIGYKLGCYHGEKIGHVYIRHNNAKHPVTEQRKRLRQKAAQPTVKRLMEVYGKDYQSKLQYFNKL